MSFQERSRWEANITHIQDATLYCRCLRRGKKVDEGESMEEKGGRTLAVSEPQSRGRAPCANQV